MEAMKILKAAWNGNPDSFRTENIIAITYFVDRYHDEYCPQRLVTQLRSTDPLKIYRDGRAVGVNLTGYKKYLFPLLCIYNENAGKNELPMKESLRRPYHSVQKSHKRSLLPRYFGKDSLSA